MVYRSAFGAIFSYVFLISDKDVPLETSSVINFVANLGALAFPPLIGYLLDVAGSLQRRFRCSGRNRAGRIGVFLVWLPKPRR